MSTNFFDRQSKARKNTSWLIAMFFLGMFLMVVVVFGIVLFAVEAANSSRPTQTIWTPRAQSLQFSGIAAAFTAGLICLGTLYKVMSLRSDGGIGVAESLGGRRAFPNSSELAERRLLNIVEEMAIASGTPVPPVYVLEEPGINAFAAGYAPNDAVIGVTRGAMELLTREQLQGVIAHEFSHILNGDMRINIRMIGILHGILLLSLIGKLIFRSIGHGGYRRQSRSSGDSGKGILYVLAIALVLIVIGSLGSFIGGLIKAAVSRQREYLADASAVQFTRNPNGIASALKRIGGISEHGILQHENAPVASHMYFAQGVFEGLTGLMATHPPLPKRILAIDPGWDGKFPKVDRKSAPMGAGKGASGFVGEAHRPVATAAAEQDQASVAVVSQAAHQIAAPDEYHGDYAADLLQEIDPVILDAAREPYTVRALVFALLLDRDDTIRKSQIDQLSKLVEAPLVQQTWKLTGHTDGLPDKAYLPLVDLALPALASMSRPQYLAFMKSFKTLAKADSKISLFEWTLGQVLQRHLRPRFEPVPSPAIHYYSLKKLGGQISLLLSTLARVGHDSDEQVRHAFAAGASHLKVAVQLLPAKQCTMVALETAVKVLSRVAAKHRGTIVDACAATVCADGAVRVREAELLRGISDLLDCPMPPLIERKV